MEIKSYNKQQLKEFIESDAFNRLSVIPISKHRAISQINNPRASTEDILLVVQFDKDNVVGYLGVLPDYLFLVDQKKNLVGYLVFGYMRRIVVKMLQLVFFLRL